MLYISYSNDDYVAQGDTEAKEEAAAPARETGHAPLKQRETRM